MLVADFPIPRNSELRQARDEEIKKLFDELRNARKCGVRKYTQQYRFHKSAQKFYLSHRTLENIVYSV